MPFVQRDGGGAVLAVFENRQPFATEQLAADHAEVKQVRERPAPVQDDSRVLLVRAVKLLAEGKPVPVLLVDKIAQLDA